MNWEHKHSLQTHYAVLQELYKATWASSMAGLSVTVSSYCDPHHNSLTQHQTLAHNYWGTWQNTELSYAPFNRFRMGLPIYVSLTLPRRIAHKGQTQYMLGRSQWMTESVPMAASSQSNTFSIIKHHDFSLSISVGFHKKSTFHFQWSMPPFVSMQVGQGKSKSRDQCHAMTWVSCSEASQHSKSHKVSGGRTCGRF